MRFNRNIYMRLYQIAFFMPDPQKGPTGKKRKFKASFLCPETNCIPVDDPLLRDKIDEIIYYVSLIESNRNYKKSKDFMEITDFERVLFFVCQKVYEGLSSLLFQFEEKFKQKIDSKTKRECCIEDAPEGFYKSIPKKAFSEDEIREKSFDMFHSAKTACYFYSKFKPSYCMYNYSEIIRKHEKDIPILKYTKETIASYFCNCPINNYPYIKKVLLNLAYSLEGYSELKHGVRKTYRNKKSLHLWNRFVTKLYDGVLINCINISKELSTKPVFSMLEFDTYKKDDLISKKEIKRRDRISKAQIDRLSERRMQVKSHIEEISKICRSQKVSVRKACGYYFKEHKSELKLININSQRTLENNYSKTEPNKQRSAFSNMAYVGPKYSPAFRKAINDICHDIMLNYHISRAKKKGTAL